jgi:hypothetical protein
MLAYRDKKDMQIFVRFSLRRFNGFMVACIY